MSHRGNRIAGLAVAVLCSWLLANCKPKKRPHRKSERDGLRSHTNWRAILSTRVR